VRGERLDASALRSDFHNMPYCLRREPSPQHCPRRLTRRKTVPALISAAEVHASTICFTHAGKSLGVSAKTTPATPRPAKHPHASPRTPVLERIRFRYQRAGRGSSQHSGR
jgi:hypothetical protein